MMIGIIREKIKRPRWLWLTGALFLFMGFILLLRNVTSGSVDPLTVEERTWLKAHPVIRFAPDPDFPPVEYFDKNGGYNGITKDYVSLLEKKLGVRFEIVRLRDWNEIIKKTKSHEIDMYFATKTPQRAEYMLFTKSFLEFPAVIITRKKVKGPLNLEKMNGMKISVVSEYAAHNFTTHYYPKLNLDLVPDVESGLRNVSFGLSDAFVENLATATYYIEKEGITNLRIAGESGYFYSLGFASRNDMPKLNQILEKGLAAISVDEKNAISTKWIPMEVRSLLASKVFQTAIFSAFGVAVLIILVIFAWNRALARQVGRRTKELEKELTERACMEEELRLAHEKLEKRVEERTTDLRNANELLEHKITERKRIEEELLLSHFCINKAAIGIFQVSLDDGKILRANDSACQSLGYSSDELCAMSVFAIDPSLTWEKFVYLVREAGSSGSLTFETIRRRKDGTTFPVEVTIHNREFHGKSTGFTFFRDITEQKRAIAELELTQFMVDKASIAIHRISEEGNILFVNDVTCEGLGYTADELYSMTVFDIDPTFNLEKFQEHRRIARAAGSRTFESIHRRKDGSTFPVEITVNYLKYQDNEFSVSFSKDISERKEAEEALRQSRAKYQTIVDAFDGLIYVCSQDYRIEFMNRKLIERTGRDAVGEYCYKVLHGRDSVCPWCVNDLVFAGETIHWDVVSPKDKRWYEVLNVPIRNADGSMSKHSVMVDINDRILFEKELQRQKKLLEEINDTLEKRVAGEVVKNREKDIMLIQQNRQAAMGEMLDHIAHQWKQPLTSISLIVQMLGETVSTGELTEDAVEDAVGKTVSLVQHMAQTIETFRGFYRQDKVKALFNIKETVEQALAFIAPDFKFHFIAVELDVDPGLTGFGYPKEYAQVILNILANARNVFRARGTEKPKVMIRAFAEDDKAVVIIADNAGGIPQAIIDKIFDFNFTTNESCGGSGIGLYMSKNIVEKNMAGTLSAANVEGGAQLRIEIPAV